MCPTILRIWGSKPCSGDGDGVDVNDDNDDNDDDHDSEEGNDYGDDYGDDNGNNDKYNEYDDNGGDNHDYTIMFVPYQAFGPPRRTQGSCTAAARSPASRGSRSDGPGWR
jgi:hypothetical protein